MEQIHKKIFIGGEWLESESKERMEVCWPGDGSVIGTVPRCTRQDAHKAIEAAIEGQKAMARLSVRARAHLLEKTMEICKRKGPEAEKILCLESGHTFNASRSEAGVNGFSWDNMIIAAENIKLYHGKTLPNLTEDSNNKKIMVNREPIGVVVNLSTFSYPSEMPNCSIPYALALGNSVIVKPSSGSPFSSIVIAEIMEEAGFPPGSINVITGSGKEVGDELVAHPGTNAINLFGQFETGKTITQRAGMKKLLMAIVSNNPLIVMDDANLDQAVGAVIGGAFGLAGQGPIATGRILVHEKVRQPFVDLLVERTRALKLMSAPLDEQADVGSMNNRILLEKALRHLSDAKQKGARCLHGGNNPRHLMLEPTIIEDVTPDMLVAHEATPGPIAPIMTFASIEEAVELANATRYGFQAGAFTSGLANAYFLSENIKAGGVFINEATNCFDEMGCFGGVKCSGMGRMLGPWILDQLSEPKLTMFDIGKVKK